MSIIEQSRGELVAALNALLKRRAQTSVPAERQAINEAIETINSTRAELNQGELLAAANIVVGAADALERVIAAAKTGPFDGTIGALEHAFQRLQAVQRAVHAQDSLPPAEDDEAEGEPGIFSAAATSAAPTPVKRSTNYPELEAEYDAWFKACKVRPQYQGNVDYYLKRLAKFRATYQQAGAQIGVPWHFIGIVHAMEAGFDFTTHLHNGDPLTARTVQVPKGRPETGNPPFTWAASAQDALKLKKLDRETDWSIPRVLYNLERYNGFGYRRMGVATPYLWSFSNLYDKGRYTRDHFYDPNAPSKQCGAGVMLKALKDKALI